MRDRDRNADETLLAQLLAQLAGRVSPPTEEELRQLAREAAARPRTPLRIARPAAALRLRWALGVIAAAFLAGGFGFGLSSWTTPSGTAGTNVAGIGFLPARGWTVVQAGTLGGTGTAQAIAANVALDPDDALSDAPVATLESLPARGVLISAQFGVRGDIGQDLAFPARPLPLRIGVAERVPAGLDPVPVRRVLARYRLRAGVGRYNIDARIYFGTATPSDAQFEVAQSQLNRLLVSSERVTLFARPTVHDRNQIITLLGSAEGAREDDVVSIEAKECDETAFKEHYEVHPNAGGGWTTQAGPTITTTYRAVWKGSRSTAVTVQERAWVQLSTRPRTRKGFGFEVAVRSQLQFWKRHVIVQRFQRSLGRWVDVKKVVLTETGAAPGSSFVWSSAEFTTAVPRGTLVRAMFPLSQAKPCYLAGYSNQLRT